MQQAHDSCTMYIMKRFQAAAARQHLSEVLDAAERGETVIIERRDVQFRVEPVAKRARSIRRAPRFQLVDPALASGEWTWTLGAKGLRFSAKGRRK